MSSYGCVLTSVANFFVSSLTPVNYYFVNSPSFLCMQKFAAETNVRFEDGVYVGIVRSYR